MNNLNRGVIYVEDKGWYWHWKGARLDSKFYKRKSAAMGKLEEYEIALNKLAKERAEEDRRRRAAASEYADRTVGTQEDFEARHDAAFEEYLSKHPLPAEMKPVV